MFLTDYAYFLNLMQHCVLDTYFAQRSRATALELQVGYGKS